jgi:cytoskeletal protein RodZ
MELVSVGESLARARQERGLSVEDVTAATRIRGGLIRSIENDEFAACGGAVYARGHIRNISRVLSIDPAPLVEEFDRTHSD